MNKYELFTTKEIKPTGWLKNQLRIQANGLNGNLDKMWPDVKDSAWIGGSKEGWERVPYWLDGFIPLAYLLNDKDMISRAKKYIDAIISFQEEDGWICPTTDRNAYDTWAVELISKVLTVYYECSGDERIPGVLYKVLKNYYDLLKAEKIKLFSWGKARWFECLIAINFLYKKYKESWILSLIKILEEQGTDYVKLIPMYKRPINVWKFETHIVNITMALKTEAVTYLSDKNYKGKAKRLYDILEKYNGTAIGLFTGDECLSGLSPIQGTELCSVVEEMYSFELLYSLTGNGDWIDRLERITYNGLVGTCSDDMWRHQYDQQANQISCCRFKGKPIFRTNSKDANLFGLEPNFGCCTANFGQGWPKFAISAFMYNDKEIVSVLPVPCKLNTNGIKIEVVTNYPFDNSIIYKIKTEKPFRFKIRIPSFVDSFIVDGKTYFGKYLVKDIKKGDKVINIELSITPKFISRPNGLFSVSYGPFVFSVPIKYKKNKFEYEKDGVERKYPYCDYELKRQGDFGFAFTSDELKVIKGKLHKNVFSSKNQAIKIETKGVKIDWGFEDGYDEVCSKVPLSLKPIGEEKELTLVPYGLAKLRMTELPKIK